LEQKDAENLLRFSNGGTGRAKIKKCENPMIQNILDNIGKV
jgi:hypothetical protein